MEKIIELKKLTEDRLLAVTENPQQLEIPTELPQFESFLSLLHAFSSDPIAIAAKGKII